LNGNYQAVPLTLSAKIANGPAHAGPVPAGSQVEIITPFSKSLLEGFGWRSVAGRQAQGSNLQTGGAEYSSRKLRHKPSPMPGLIALIS
jgi:hypothetical protein